MIKHISTIIIFLFSLSSFAQVSVEECTNQLHVLGRGLSKKQIDSNCFMKIKKTVNSKAIVKTSNNSIEIYGAINSIFIENTKNNTFKVIAGSKSTLNSITAVEYDEMDKSIYILEKNSGIIKVFSDSIEGNIAPLRVIEINQLVGAVDLAVNGEHLFILNSKENSVIVINKSANSKVRERFRNIGIVDTLLNIPESVNSIKIINDQLHLDSNDQLIKKLKLINK
jgi:hypothetical protein